jgi:transcriptional regulator with GAF, ATPase, and Fis domain
MLLAAAAEPNELAETVVGARAGLKSVIERVDQVAPTDAPALILGETGSGKEVIARAIHARSRRCSGPLVRVNCGAIPPELVDSELFGHEKGAFTGAVSARRGWFERADGGTLFLDEIAELPLAAQVRLLRVLQDGAVERVGAESAADVDVRIVAATHRDLAAMVAAGTFREDLWYRIHVFPIRLPPLRERKSDIPALAAHFAALSGTRLRGAPIAPDEDDVAQLVAYSWPGNVRELAAVIERAAILGGPHRLDVRAALGPVARPSSSKFATLDEAQRAHIEAALERTRGRVEGRDGAAALLGLNPHTLRGRMRRLGVDWARFRAA